ncbi:hypothetical protein [Streptomyces sp. NPDC002851]
MTRRRTVALGAAVLALTAVPAASAVGDQEPRSTTRQIASATLGTDYKVTLTALRSSTDPYTASVRLQVLVHEGGAWKESDRTRVGAAEGWFWNPLTGSRAVREFSTASTEPAPIRVSLLITPSIGYSDPYAYLIRDGKISPQ